MPEKPQANTSSSKSHSKLVIIKNGNESFPVENNPIFNKYLACPGSGLLRGDSLHGELCIREYSVSKECDGTIPDRLAAESTAADAAVVALIIPLVKAISKYFLGKVDKTLSEKLEGYSAVHGASDWHTPGPTVRCLRYTRYDGPNTSSPIALDILYAVSAGDFGSAEDSNSEEPNSEEPNSEDSGSVKHAHPLWIRPLRVFHKTPATANDSVDGKYAIASALTLRAIGAQKPLPSFTTELLSRTYGESAQMAGARIEYYEASSSSNGGQYIPNINHLVENGLAVSLSVEVSEVGTPPDFLKNFSEFIAASKGDMAGALAALAKVELEE